MAKINNPQKNELSRAKRTSILIRDNYTCQKCKLEDKTAKKLEIHHIKPLVFNGTNEDKNLITLCYICHKYAPNKEEEFKEYIDSECDGQLTLLIKTMKELKGKNREDTFNKVNKNHIQKNG